MTAPIIVEDYDPTWPERFEIFRSRISAALGPLAAAIEHIGSTAVPGLSAKPVLDMDVLLLSIDDLPAAIRQLATIGYIHQGDLGVPGREAFRAPVGDFSHHLYVCSPDCQEYIRHLAFRDHLRSHSRDADVYACLKRSLAARYGTDRDAYTQAKTEFIESILRCVQTATAEHSSPATRIIP